MDSSHSKLCFQAISDVSRFHSSNVWNNPSLACPRADPPSSDLPFQMLLCLDVPGICSKWCGLLFGTSVSSQWQNDEQDCALLLWFHWAKVTVEIEGTLWLSPFSDFSLFHGKARVCYTALMIHLIQPPSCLSGLTAFSFPLFLLFSLTFSFTVYLNIYCWFSSSQNTNFLFHKFTVSGTSEDIFHKFFLKLSSVFSNVLQIS